MAKISRVKGQQNVRSELQVSTQLSLLNGGHSTPTADLEADRFPSGISLGAVQRAVQAP